MGKKKEKRLVIDDPAKIAVVRRIFREYVEDDRPMKNIADRLNDESFVSPAGGSGGGASTA